MKNLSALKIGLTFGVFSIGFYLLCILWGGLFQSVELKELHFQLLQLTYPGFSYTILGYFIGIIETFIYGYVIGIFFTFLCKKSVL